MKHNVKITFVADEKAKRSSDLTDTGKEEPENDRPLGEKAKKIVRSSDILVNLPPLTKN